MPLIRKIVQLGNSKAITIPPSWLENLERETGYKITEIAMDVNGALTLRPVLKQLPRSGM